MERTFVVGPPVRGDLFYGRKELLNSVNFGNNYALVGIRRVGKTSIILELARRFKQRGVVPVIVSLFEISPLTVENFLKRYALAVTRAYLEDASLLGKIEGFIDGKKEGLSDFLKNIKISVSLQEIVSLWFEHREKKQKDYTEAIEKTILYPEKLAMETGKKFVIFLDEFQEIKQLRILNALRDYMQKTPSVSYIISGSAVGMLAQIVGSRRSPFYGFFMQKQIKGLDEKSAAALLARAKKSGVCIAPGVIGEVIRRTHGYPLYLQAFGHAAVDTAFSMKSRKIGEDLLEDCWKKMYESIYFHFEYLESELKGKKRVVTEAVSVRGARTVSEISKATGIPINALGTYMKRLVQEGILEKSGSTYAFSDPVFEEWLRRNKTRSL